MLWSRKLNIIAAITVKIPDGFSRRHESMNTYPICHSLGAAITVLVCEQKPYPDDFRAGANSIQCSVNTAILL